MKINFSKPKFKRKIKAQKKQLASIGESANKHLDRNFFRRWSNIKGAQRFIIGWLALVILLFFGTFLQIKALDKHYLSSSPTNGGIYSEGVIGSFSNANPIFATSAADLSVSKLVFSSLLTYDDEGKLVGDLAQSWESNPNSQVYTVTLKDNLKWHDGQPLTADDVVFTYQLVQNPDVKSPLNSGWRGVRVEKVDDKKIKFTLTAPYSPFANNLTNGILPKHLLESKSPSSLRSDQFNNQSPIGSGPFRWSSINQIDEETKEIALSSNTDYHRGPPSLDGLVIVTYPDANSLNKALAGNDLTAAAGLSLKDSEFSDFESYPFVTNSANMIFLKNSSANLADVKVRQALLRATNATKLSELVGYQAIPVREPILNNQIGYDPAYRQLSYDKTEAEKLLDSAGWVKPEGGQYRQKNSQDLSLKLVSENNTIYPELVAELQKQWAEVGVKVDASFVSQNEITQTYIPNHQYDVFLYSINIGPDPDVYAYWHSSQSEARTSRLNLSEFKSGVSDLALESGRSRQDTNLRAAKYKPFLNAWKNEAPAIGLYQPRFLYLTNQPVYGIENSRHINVPEDRFNNVHNWKINTTRVIQK